MKLTHKLFSLFAAYGVLSALAAPAALAISCNGSSNTFGQSISGDCNQGHCRAYLPSQNADASGYCDSSVSFNATAYTFGQSLSDTCTNGELRIHLPGGSYNWSGTCSDGSSFHGDSYGFGQTLTATCTDEGTFSLYIPGENVSVNGTCN